MFLKAILIGGVLPGLLSALALGALWWRTRRPAPNRAASPRWALPVLSALALLPAEVLVRAGPPRPWPVAGADRVPHAALCILLFSLAEIPAAGRPLASFAFRFIGAAGAFWITLGVRVPAFWTPVQALLWIGTFALLAAAVATLLDRLADAHDDSASVTAALAITTSSLPIVLLHSGNAYLAQLAGGLAASLGAATLISGLIPSFTIARAGISTAVTLAATLLLCGHYYGPRGIPVAQSALLSLAPLAPLVTLIPAVRRLGRWKRCAVAAAFALLLAGTAPGLAWSGAPAETDDPYAGW